MNQSQDNFRTEGGKDGRTDRPQFIGPFWPGPTVQKETIDMKQVNRHNDDIRTS